MALGAAARIKLPPALEAAFPPIQAFATDILPGVKATPATVAATLPWIEQVQASLSPAELGGVAEGLLAAAPSLAQLTSEQAPFYNQTDQFNKCLTKVFFPAGNAKLQDGTKVTVATGPPGTPRAGGRSGGHPAGQAGAGPASGGHGGKRQAGAGRPSSGDVLPPLASTSTFCRSTTAMLLSPGCGRVAMTWT